jgi:hypothetical protein
MKRSVKFISFVCLTLFVIYPAGGFSQESLPKAEFPVLITSCGQSPGATMLKVIFNRLDLETEPAPYEVNVLAAADDLQAAEESGRPFQSLIIVMGASLKGMGAAGISIDDELKRIDALISTAKAKNITIIGAHIEGMKRRAQGASPGDNTDELSIDAVAPESDILLINKSGNEDQRFTNIAENQDIPMVTVEKNLELIPAMKQLFNLELP